MTQAASLVLLALALFVAWLATPLLLDRVFGIHLAMQVLRRGVLGPEYLSTILPAALAHSSAVWPRWVAKQPWAKNRALTFVDERLPYGWLSRLLWPLWKGAQFEMQRRTVERIIDRRYRAG
jgi:hypothetical protein